MDDAWLLDTWTSASKYDETDSLANAVRRVFRVMGILNWIINRATKYIY